MAAPRNLVVAAAQRLRLALRFLLWALLFFLLAEVGYRGWLAAEGRPYLGSRTLAELRATIEAMQLPVGDPALPAVDPLPGAVPHPYFAWDQKDQIESYNQVASYFARSDPAEIFDIVLVGGSAARALHDHGQPQLRKAFQADPDFPYEKLRILFLGHSAFKQPQQVNVLTYALGLGWKPELVVNVDGYNELAFGNLNYLQHVHPLNPSAAHWQHLDLSEGSDGLAMDRLLDAHQAREQAGLELRRLERGLWRSALLSAGTRDRCAAFCTEFSYKLRLFEDLAFEERPLAVAGPPLKARFEKRLDLIAGQWLESSRMLHAICEAHASDYLHVLAPSAGNGAGVLSEQARALPRVAESAVEAGYPMLRELSTNLVSEGVLFVDASRLFAGQSEEHFDSGDGINAAGARDLANFVARSYLERKRAP